MSSNKPTSFIIAAKNYFGLKEGQTSTDFMKEVKALSHADKLEIAAAIRATGVDVLDPAESK